MEKHVVAVMGPTASGKSALALELAERFQGEILCADSATVYRGLDVGTAKPSHEERQRVPHHLLDLLDPDETFNLNRFLERVPVKPESPPAPAPKSKGFFKK